MYTKVPKIKAFLRYKDRTPVLDGTLTTYTYSENEIEIELPNLTSVSLSNGEGERSSTVQISFIDENFTIDRALFERAISEGGVAVPQNLVVNEEKTQQTGESLLNVTGAYTVPPEGTKGDDLAIAIINYCNVVGVTDTSHIASILGNIEIETVMGTYTEEIGGSSKRYAPYYGRGLIQITWRDNYQRFGDFYGEDFVNNPELVKQLRYAIPIAVGGMTGVKGSPTFTGLKLSDFGSGATFDFKGARKTVNGTDKDNFVASASKKWLKRIPTLTTPTTTPDTTTDTTLINPTEIIEEENVILDPIPESAIEIRVEIELDSSTDIYTSSFWYTGRQMSSSMPPTTTINGRGVRFLINKTNRKNYDSISLRQLTKRIGDDYGIEVSLPNDSALDASLSAKQRESDYNFLLRIAKALGFDVRQKNTEPPSITLHRFKDVPRIESKEQWKPVFNCSTEATENKIFQEYPTIDSLPDGELIGENFPATLEINYPTIDVLSIFPGSVLILKQGSIPNIPIDSVYYREYKIKAINTNWDGGLKVSLDLYIPIKLKEDDKVLSPDIENIEETGTPGIQKSDNTGTNADILPIAEAYIGKEFQPYRKQASMQWIRQALTEANHPKADSITATAKDGATATKDTPNSLTGDDIGNNVPGVGFMQVGDLISYRNTYGNFKKGTITDVAIYAGNDQIIYRNSNTGKIVKGDIPNYFNGKLAYITRLDDTTPTP